VAGSIPKAAVRFAAFEQLTRALKDENGKMSATRSMLAGAWRCAACFPGMSCASQRSCLRGACRLWRRAHRGGGGGDAHGDGEDQAHRRPEQAAAQIPRPRARRADDRGRGGSRRRVPRADADDAQARMQPNGALHHLQRAQGARGRRRPPQARLLGDAALRVDCGLCIGVRHHAL
jgi:hypothetical protein